MKKQVYLVACSLLCFNFAQANVANVTPKYLDGIVRAYRAMGEEDLKNKTETICALNEKFQTAIKTLGDKKTLMIPLDSQANVFIGLEASEATQFGQKFQEAYATELQACQK
jgi:hypothetical protein